MPDTTGTTTQPGAAIPPDNANNKLTVASPEDPRMRHVSVAGGTYTILVTGAETSGRYCLIDMLVPPGDGPPPAPSRLRGDVHDPGGRNRVEFPG